jgi:surface polysaccharide O-acyltransferase-like enzyme
MSEFDFIEKQYLGLNKISLTRRMALAIFCFVAYYWRVYHEKSGELYFFIGLGIMIISIILFFILHFKTKVKNGSVILDGLWTARKIKINTVSIVSVKKVQYSKYFLNRAVYNLHLKGTIRFYTRGTDAVELIDKDGLVYLIGSQKAEELARVIQKKLA